MKENPHILRLFLDSPLDVALTKYQATNTLGRSYAGLLVFIEGLRRLDLIGEVVYQHYKSRYLRPLPTLPVEEPAARWQREEQQKTLQQIRKKLRDVIDQFTALQPKARQYWLKYALERPEIPESTELLRKFSKKEVAASE